MIGRGVEWGLVEMHAALHESESKGQDQRDQHGCHQETDSRGKRTHGDAIKGVGGGTGTGYSAARTKADVQSRH